MLRNRYAGAIGAIRRARANIRPVPYDNRRVAVRRLIRTIAQRGAGIAAGMAVTKGLDTIVNSRYQPRVSKKFTRRIGHGTAWKKKRKLKALRTAPRVGYKFKTKVQKVLNYDKPYGEYAYLSDVRLHQDTKNQWKAFATDNNAKNLEQFSMAQVWDAASILFNDKTPSNNWDNDITNGANHNVRYKQSIHIINSFTTFEFKSTSAHVVNVQMFICSPKQNAVSDLPSTLATQSSTGTVNQYWYLDNSEAPTAGTFDVVQNEGAAPYMWTNMFKEFNVEQVNFKFNPGEQKKYFLQGPKNYTMDGSKLAFSNGTTPGVSKVQKYVWFRVINDPTVSGVSSGSVATNTIARYPSNYRGGVAMRQKRIIRVRCPDTLDADAYADIAENRQNGYIIGQWNRIDPLDEDQQVIVNNPITTTTQG